MKSKIVLGVSAVALLFLQTACANLTQVSQNQVKTNMSSDRLTIINNESELSSLVQLKSEAIEISPGVGISSLRRITASKKETNQVTLTLIAEVAPPVIDGKTLQANCITLWADFAYVGYNYQGDEQLGAVDIIQLTNGDKVNLRSRVLFNDADINGLDGDNKNIYCAESKASVEGGGAQIEILNVDGGKISMVDTQQKALLSFAATCATKADSLFVTSGSTGGLYAFDAAGLTEQAFVELPDARWINCQDQTVAVIQGQPGNVSVYEFNGKAFQLARSFDFAGADVAEAKSYAQIVGEHIFIAAGSGGVQVHQFASGTKTASIPVPNVAGLDAKNVVTNQLTIDEDLIFIGNGEAGVYVAQANGVLADIKAGNPISFNTIGQLQLSSLDSVNHMVLAKGYLYVASGKGGFKIIEVTKK